MKEKLTLCYVISVVCYENVRQVPNSQDQLYVTVHGSNTGLYLVKGDGCFGHLGLQFFH